MLHRYRRNSPTMAAAAGRVNVFQRKPTPVGASLAEEGKIKIRDLNLKQVYDRKEILNLVAFLGMG